MGTLRPRGVGRWLPAPEGLRAAGSVPGPFLPPPPRFPRPPRGGGRAGPGAAYLVSTRGGGRRGARGRARRSRPCVPAPASWLGGAGSWGVFPEAPASAPLPASCPLPAPARHLRFLPLLAARGLLLAPWVQAPPPVFVRSSVRPSVRPRASRGLPGPRLPARRYRLARPAVRPLRAAAARLPNPCALALPSPSLLSRPSSGGASLASAALPPRSLSALEPFYVLIFLHPDLEMGL